MNKKQATFKIIEDNLQNLLEKLDSPETEATIKDWLKTASHFHKYSYSNQILLTVQAEARGAKLSKVASFSAWKRLGAKVLKGSKAFSVMFPVEYIIYKLDAKGRNLLDAAGNKIPELDKNGKPLKRMTFWVGPVFDVAQTNARDIGVYKKLDTAGHGDISPGMVAEIQATAAQAFGVSIVDDATMPYDGCYSYMDNEIRLKPTLEGDPASRLSVLFHELGHMVLHSKELANGELSYDRMHAERGYREGEAEAFAYALSTRFGIAVKSELYIAGWGNTVADLRERMQKISTGLKTFCKTVDIDKYFEHIVEPTAPTLSL